MSVVNRMLLDIDQRHGAADIKAKGPYPDIRSVPPRGAIPGRKPIVALLAVVGVLALAVGVAHRAGWFERAPLPVVRPLASAPAPAPIQTPAAVPATVPALSAPPVPHDSPAAPFAAVVAAREDVPAPAPSSAAGRTRAAGPGVEPFKLSRELSNLDERLATAPAVAVGTPRAPVVSPSAPSKAPPPLRQVAGEETVAVARALWNGGARADALATLREALVVAEGARHTAAVAPITRELARLEVADNRPQVALDLLRRLEGSLGDDAEAWALRGNAEQRLAMHGESSRSYLAALRMRPAESRWMLGAAISLAAEGKVDEAQAWAERARERGAMTPAIESYLQQLGVALRP